MFFKNIFILKKTTSKSISFPKYEEVEKYQRNKGKISKGKKHLKNNVKIPCH